ncbi:cysteine dioxygenase [Calidifontibacter sp. DB0510]|uniref:Cysteine dioxygenase n=1 Tax=Metallococcus carri TaxID=1656884 RepID=A0A967B5U9_9MICO|nr:cysteine dioxygenase family protein [Metallococcus carri]NHN56157.1 cysteine dioxygenase [Metallococcus carri]NOP38792.1 cysteine dioxygenase [Calidifontibacter sp. DB2511S]
MSSTAFAPRTLTDTELVELVCRVAADRALWEPLVRFDRGERQWARISVPEGVDVWVICWEQSQGTRLHDHGDASAAFTTVRGTIAELRPRGGQLIARDLAEGAVQSVRPGDIHDVRNERREPAVTIHAYAPALTQMTYYDLHSGRLLVDRVVRSDEPEGHEW